MKTYTTSPFTGRKIVDLRGQKWNKLTAIEPAELPEHINRKQPKQFWLFQCDCGNTKVLDPGDVTRQKNPTQSCGCLRTQIIEDRKPKYFKETSFDQISDNYMKYHTYNGERAGRKERGISFNLTKQDLWDLWVKQEGKCAYTGLDLLVNFTSTTKYKECTASLDRIDSSKSYEVGNVEWVHKQVNVMKNIFSKQSFIEFCKLISKNNNYEY